MREPEIIRYCVHVKKSYKILFMISTIIMIILAGLCLVFSIGKCETLGNYFAVMVCIVCFVFAGVACIISMRKRVEVCKGKIIYHNGIWKKEYHMSDICCAKKQTESFYVDHGDGNVTSSWDIVTTFYDRSGKKLFKFGLAYENVDRLQKDVENTQKSIAGLRNSKKKHF